MAGCTPRSADRLIGARPRPSSRCDRRVLETTRRNARPGKDANHAIVSDSARAGADRQQTATADVDGRERGAVHDSTHRRNRAAAGDRERCAAAVAELVAANAEKCIAGQLRAGSVYLDNARAPIGCDAGIGNAAEAAGVNNASARNVEPASSEVADGEVVVANGPGRTHAAHLSRCPSRPRSRRYARRY